MTLSRIKDCAKNIGFNTLTYTTLGTVYSFIGGNLLENILSNGFVPTEAALSSVFGDLVLGTGIGLMKTPFAETCEHDFIEYKGFKLGALEMLATGVTIPLASTLGHVILESIQEVSMSHLKNAVIPFAGYLMVLSSATFAVIGIYGTYKAFQAARHLTFFAPAEEKVADPEAERMVQNVTSANQITANL